MTTPVKDQLIGQIIDNISNILKDQASINRSQSEMNGEIYKIVQDLKFRVEQLENQVNEGDK